MTPLRKELVKWCGYRYLPKQDIWYRKNSLVNLKYYSEEDKWYAYHGPDHHLCQVLGLAHLTQIILAIEGDTWPLIIKFPKK